MKGVAAFSAARSAEQLQRDMTELLFCPSPYFQQSLAFHLLFGNAPTQIPSSSLLAYEFSDCVSRRTATFLAPLAGRVPLNTSFQNKELVSPSSNFILLRLGRRRRGRLTIHQKNNYFVVKNAHVICICNMYYCYWLYSLRRARMWGKTWSFALSAHRTTKKKEEKQRR